MVHEIFGAILDDGIRDLANGVNGNPIGNGHATTLAARTIFVLVVTIKEAAEGSPPFSAVVNWMLVEALKGCIDIVGCAPREHCCRTMRSMPKPV